jgi:phage terminase Nu1 subunit (DNA packaging protein)
MQDHLTAYAASRLLEKDRQTIVRALKDVPPDDQTGSQQRWKLATIVKALEGGSRSSAGGKSQEAGLTEARAELARQQSEAVAFKNAIARGEFVPAAEVLKSASIVVATFRERILAIPGKIAASCEMRSRGEVEEAIRSELYEALDELSRPILPVNGGDFASDSADLGEGPELGEAAAEPLPD